MMVRPIRLDRRQFYLFEGLGINSLKPLCPIFSGAIRAVLSGTASLAYLARSARWRATRAL